MNNNINIRLYQNGDEKFTSQIFYNTIHKVNCKDYTKEQLNAWAPESSLEQEGWAKKYYKIKPLIALLDTKIVGFAEFEENGHIDCFYVHHQFQGCGIGRALMDRIIQKAKSDSLSRVYAEVSITAKSFFEHYGFKVIKEQRKIIRKVELCNYLMEKLIK
jgi:putative acetyltransferase